MDFAIPDLLAPRAGVRSPQLAEATKFLVELLQDGPVPAIAIRTEAVEAGVSDRTLHRAKDELGVHSERRGRPGRRGRGEWVWRLPD